MNFSSFLKFSEAILRRFATLRRLLIQPFHKSEILEDFSQTSWPHFATSDDLTSRMTVTFTVPG